MTFSRAQMIEAWLDGYYFSDHEVGTNKARIAATSYVDSLQDASPGLSDALRSDDLLGYRPTLNPEIERLDTTIREHILKTRERELVLAKVLGSLLANLPVWVQVKNPDAYIDTMAHYAGELNRVFPELTPEE